MKTAPTLQSTPPNAPWYKNYVMWVFVIGLPAFVVMACVCFVFFAIKIKDSTVRDDWYMDGKSLYQDISKDQLAHDLGLSGVMRFNNGTVRFELNHPQSTTYPTTLQVRISHATDKSKDQDFVLTHQNGSAYQGNITLDPLPAKYYINVVSEEGQWRLTQTQKLPADNVVFLPLKAFDQSNQTLPDQRHKRANLDTLSN